MSIEKICSKSIIEMHLQFIPPNFRVYASKFAIFYNVFLGHILGHLSGEKKIKNHEMKKGNLGFSYSNF